MVKCFKAFLKQLIAVLNERDISKIHENGLWTYQEVITVNILFNPLVLIRAQRPTGHLIWFFTCVHLWWSLVMAWTSQIRVWHKNKEERSKNIYICTFTPLTVLYISNKAFCSSATKYKNKRKGPGFEISADLSRVQCYTEDIFVMLTCIVGLSSTWRLW